MLSAVAKLFLGLCSILEATHENPAIAFALGTNHSSISSPSFMPHHLDDINYQGSPRSIEVKEDLHSKSFVKGKESGYFAVAEGTGHKRAEESDRRHASGVNSASSKANRRRKRSFIPEAEEEGPSRKIHKVSGSPFEEDSAAIPSFDTSSFDTQKATSKSLHGILERCGNRVCDTEERCDNCPGDCGPCQPQMIQSTCKHSNHFLLTFDDGPSVNTPALLDVLKAYNVPATFFVMGKNLKARPEILQRQIREGHFIASHTMTHPDLSVMGAAEVRKEMLEMEQLVYEASGCVRPKVMRPPYGEINGHTLQTLHDIGYMPVLWNVDTYDWRDAKDDPRGVLKRFETALRAKAQLGKSSIVHLQHDLLKESVDLVPTIIDMIRSYGYRFVSVPECLYGSKESLHQDPSLVFSYGECKGYEVREENNPNHIEADMGSLSPNTAKTERAQGEQLRRGRSD